MNSLESHQHAVRESFRSKTDKVLEFAKAQDNKIKELTEQNKKLEERCESTALERDGALDDIEKLKEENKKLKEQIFGIKDSEITIEGFIEQIVRLGSENEKLKEENEKFKKERNTIWETMSKDPALVLLLPDSMYDAGMDSESEEEEEEEEAEQS